MISVLIIDDDPHYREYLTHHIGSEWNDAVVRGVDPAACLVNGSRLPPGINIKDFDVVLLDRAPAGDDGLLWLRDFKTRPGFPPVIFVTDRGNELMAVDAIKAGAEDYLLKQDLNHDRFVASLRSAMRKRKRTSALLSRRQALDEAYRFGAIKIRGQRFVRELGAGGISSVYLAESEKEDRLVVLKVFRQVPDVADVQSGFDRFIQEYEVISKIAHPNVVKIYDLGVADDHAYIAMEYFSEGNLRSQLHAALSVDVAMDYLRQIACALRAIHSVGVLHRDLKPANVMLREDGTIALIDFGLAKQMSMEQEITETGEIFGTPYYMSPEQGHADQVDERSDIYSLGVLFFEMICNRKPFIASSPMAVIYKHSHAPLPSLPAGLRDYQELIDTLLAKDPRDRFQSAEELIAFLDARWQVVSR